MKTIIASALLALCLLAGCAGTPTQENMVSDVAETNTQKILAEPVYEKEPIRYEDKHIKVTAVKREQSGDEILFSGKVYILVDHPDHGPLKIQCDRMQYDQKAKTLFCQGEQGQLAFDDKDYSPIKIREHIDIKLWLLSERINVTHKHLLRISNKPNESASSEAKPSKERREIVKRLHLYTAQLDKKDPEQIKQFLTDCPLEKELFKKYPKHKKVIDKEFAYQRKIFARKVNADCPKELVPFMVEYAYGSAEKVKELKTSRKMITFLLNKGLSKGHLIRSIDSFNQDGDNYTVAYSRSTSREVAKFKQYSFGEMDVVFMTNNECKAWVTPLSLQEPTK